VSSFSSGQCASFNRELSAHLHKIRVQAGLSQSALATELDLDQAAVSRVESGERRLNTGETILWLNTLGLSLPQICALFSKLWDKTNTKSESFWELEVGKEIGE
jgi:Helix-turn-helix.